MDVYGLTVCCNTIIMNVDYVHYYEKYRFKILFSMTAMSMILL